MQFQMMTEMVERFHERNGVSAVQRIGTLGHRPDLEKIGNDLCKIADKLERLMVSESAEDKRVLRMHLLCEEMGELFIAMSTADEIETLDGLADLLYVLIGSAITMDLPLGEAFVEVHTSNMTKTKQPTDPSAERLRSKGPDYKAPDIEKVLKAYREGSIPRRFNDGITLKDK